MDFSGAVDLGKKAKKKTQVVEETDIGLYVWEMPDGKWVGDDAGNFMTIAAKKGDRKRIAQLTDAAAHYGVTEGGPRFLAGHRTVSEEEYQEQRERFMLGLIPDKEDNYSQLDGIRNDRYRK